MTNRLKWVDIFKGILIFLMVLAHTQGWWVPYIYMFHMAAFIIVSGYTDKIEKNEFIPYLIKKAKKLVVPFFGVNLFLLLIYFGLSHFTDLQYIYINSVSVENIFNLFKYFWTTDLGGATWFLIVLFGANILSKLIYEILKYNSKIDNKKIPVYHLVTSFILYIFTYLLFYNNHESISYFIDLIPAATLLLSIGYNLSKINLKNISKFIYLTLFSLSIIYIYWFVNFNYLHIEWPTRNLQSPFVFIFSTLCGTVVIYCISILIEKIFNKFKKNIIEYVGKNTLSILCFHFLGFRVFYLLLYKIGFLKKSGVSTLVPLYHDNWLCLVTCIFSIIFSIILYKFLIFIRKKVINLFNKSNKNVSYLIIIIVLILISSSWVLSSYNYFLLDDWNNLVTLPYTKFSEFISFLPTSVYCSRPGGWFIVKILLILFGKNYKMHAISMIFLHVINTVLSYFIVFNICKKNKNRENISMICSLLFALYPISSFATFWEAGMFDLFGLTLMLISFLTFLFMNNIEKWNLKKVILTVILIFSYYFSVRTKEMFITFPGIVGIYVFFQYLIENKYDLKMILRNFREFILKNIHLIILIIIMFVYFYITQKLNTADAVTQNVNDPYYYSFNPIGMIKNLFAYIYVYFSTDSMVYGDVLSIINYDIHYKLFILILCCSSLIYSIYKFFKHDFIPLFILVSFIFSIFPVLPMVNMHHILYLYAPSFFIAFFISYSGFDIFKNYIISGKFIIIVTIILMIYCNLCPSVKNFRNWWLNTANRDRLTYNYFVDISKDYNVNKVYINNVPLDYYTSLWNGKGFIVKVAFDNPKLKVYLNNDNYNLKDNDTLVLDFNNYDFKILKDKKNKDK